MPNYYLTKIWGYDPPNWPVLAFGTVGGVNKLQSEYSTGDWVILVGTKTEQTAEEDRGRLLGMVQVTNTVVDVQEVLESLETPPREQAYKEDGSFRWPTGFPYLKAMSFVDKPLLEDVLPDWQSGRVEAAYAMLISHEQTQKILSLPMVEEAFPIAPILKSNIKLKNLLTQNGPVPAIGDRSSTYEDGENWVYIFRIKGTDFYKVGRSNDIQRRLSEFNSSPHAVWSGKLLEVVGSHPFENANEAHDVEQMLHKHLSDYSKGFECFEIAKDGVAFAALGNVLVEYSKGGN